MQWLSNRFFVCICWCACILTFAVPRCADAFQFGNGLHGVSGRVFDEQTHGILARVDVTLRGASGVMQAQMMTNESGRFDFSNLARGSYEIEAKLNGYEPYNTAVNVGEGGTWGMTIYLKRSASTQEAPSGTSVSAHELSMPKKARDLMYSGKQKVYFGKSLADGLADFQSAVAIAPDYYEAYYQIGMTLMQLSKPQDAENNFHKSIELSKGTYGEPVIGMGAILLDKADNAGGEKMIRRGLELSPNFWLGYYELGRACLAENQLADAKKAGEQARSLMPDAAIVYRLLANVHMREKDYPALLDDIDAYLKIDPSSPAGAHAREMRAQVIQKIRDEKVVSENGAPK
jgi:tetratricopeptide (TPR) repeat protein